MNAIALNHPSSRPAPFRRNMAVITFEQPAEQPTSEQTAPSTGGAYPLAQRRKDTGFHRQAASLNARKRVLNSEPPLSNEAVNLKYAQTYEQEKIWQPPFIANIFASTEDFSKASQNKSGIQKQKPALAAPPPPAPGTATVPKGPSGGRSKGNRKSTSDQLALE